MRDVAQTHAIDVQNHLVEVLLGQDEKTDNHSFPERGGVKGEKQIQVAHSKCCTH